MGRPGAPGESRPPRPGSPPHHREALVLRNEGLSHQEIADAMGISPPQAKALIHRAKKSFRRAWGSVKERRRGNLGLVLLPLLWKIPLPKGLKRLVYHLSDGAGAIGSNPAVANAAASGGERVTATVAAAAV